MEHEPPHHKEHCDHCTPVSEEIRDGRTQSAPDNGRTILWASGMLSLAIIAGAGIWAWTVVSSRNAASNVQTTSQSRAQATNAQASPLQELVTPSRGVVLPVMWGSIGKHMVDAGVIDEAQFKALYAQRGGLTADMRALLDSSDNGNLVITPQNAGTVLNLLWAFGLGNKNRILERGPMVTYGGGAGSPAEALAKAGRFASTGGWTLAQGNPMNHYSAHQFVTLTADQQTLVEKVAKNIYRPCCGNSTYFPDCNHGMAMLGLLELMASQGASENQMYQAALAVNSYWFPDTYRTITRYFESRGTKWSNVNPQEVLGASYSSGQGFARIQSLVAPEPPTQSQGGCGVDAGAGQQQTIQPQRQQGGCGV